MGERIPPSLAEIAVQDHRSTDDQEDPRQVQRSRPKTLSKKEMTPDYGWAGNYNTSRHPIDVEGLEAAAGRFADDPCGDSLGVVRIDTGHRIEVDLRDVAS